MKITDLEDVAAPDGTEPVLIIKGGRARRTALAGLMAAAGTTRLVLVTLTGPGPHALDAIDHAAKRVRIGNGAATAPIGVTLPDAPQDGTCILVRQIDAGQLRFATLAGIPPVNRQGHDATAGEGAGVSLTFEDGAWYIEGDTGVIA